METPAFDSTSGAQRKNQFVPGEGWDVWRSETDVLHRLAGSKSSAEGDTGVDASDKFGTWTEEVRAVVQRVSSAAQKNQDGKSKPARSSKKGNKKTGQATEDVEDEEDEGYY